MLISVPYERCISEEEGERLLGKEAPWAAKMAISIDAARGSPHESSMPSNSPCLADNLLYDDLKEVQFPDAFHAACEYDWIVQDTLHRFAGGDATSQEWRRLMGLVHSRTFRLPHPSNHEEFLRVIAPVIDQVYENA